MSTKNYENIYNNYELLEKERNETQKIIRQDGLLTSIYKDTTIKLTSNYYNYMLYFLIVIFLLILLFNFIPSSQQIGGSNNKKHSSILLYLFLMVLIIYNASIKK